MTLSFLRPVILAALAAATLAGCGGKATFDIAGVIAGLEYPGLVLVETKSGQTLTVDKTQTTFSFANSIEYGTEYEVKIKDTDGQPAHQTCLIYSGGTGTAGRQASINVQVVCTATPHTVGGTIKLAGTTGSYAGLKLINGSNDLNPLAPAAGVTTYSYSGITYKTPYGITIFAQPTDETIKCVLKPVVEQSTDTPLKVAGTMGDVDVVINVECAKVAP
jgi:hypothetical protein